MALARAGPCKGAHTPRPAACPRVSHSRCWALMVFPPLLPALRAPWHSDSGKTETAPIRIPL